MSSCLSTAIECPKDMSHVINLIGGPGCGKSVISAAIFCELKLRGYVTEYVQEYAKKLVWTKNFDTLNNQYYVTNKMVNQIECMVDRVTFIVTDGPIIHGLYYNKHNPDNICNIQKTEDYILKSHNKFNNINIFLQRGNFAYETHGRMQNEREAIEIDEILIELLNTNNIEFTSFVSDIKNTKSIVDYILSKINFVFEKS